MSTLIKEYEDTDVLVEEELEKNLVIHNDEVNSIDHVVNSLIVVCEHSVEQAEQITLIAHFNGKAQARHGSYEELSPMRVALVERGIKATIE